MTNTTNHTTRPATTRVAVIAAALALLAALVIAAFAGGGSDGAGAAVQPRSTGELPSDYVTPAVIAAAEVLEAQAAAYLVALAEAEAAEAAALARAEAEAAERRRATPPPVAPVTPAPAEPAPEVASYDPASIEGLVCAAFGPACAAALRVVACESNFNPGTVGAAGERGLFQVHPVHIPYLAERGMSWDAMFDPAANIAYAHDLWSRSGWWPWTCKP